MKRFFHNLKNYFRYTVFSAKAELNAEVSDSYLGALWWLLDPVCMMLIYTFIVTMVFGRKEEYLPVFVFIGLTIWNFFNKLCTGSVKLMRQNKGIVTKVYVPKYIIVLEKVFVFLFKAMISFALVFVLMIVYQVPFSIKWVVCFIPLLVTLVILTFGFCTILMHFGVFIEDLQHVVEILLKLVFYLSGVFYDITVRIANHPILANVLLKLNPVAFIMTQFRNVLLYDTWPDFLWLGIWFVIGIALSLWGIDLVHKYENSYAKVV